MAYLSESHELWSARAVGAVAGAAISLIYMLPKGRREAASRFITGLVCGMIFGPALGVWIADKLRLADGLAASEIMLAGSALASLTAWWAMGALKRLAEKWVQ
jgi:MFS family permease